MLNRPPRPDDQKEDRVFGTHPGDLGVIAIAAMCTIALILMLILPSPFQKYEKMQAETAKAEKQKEIDKAVASGEVSVGILPAKQH
jgi:hypothetical protein